MKTAPALERDDAVLPKPTATLEPSDPLPDVGDCLSRGSFCGGCQPQSNATSLAIQLHEANRIAKPVKFWTSDAPSCCRSWQSINNSIINNSINNSIINNSINY